MGLEELDGSDEGSGLGGSHEGRQDGHALLAGLSDPSLGVDQGRHHRCRDVLQVEFVAGEGQKGEHHDVQHVFTDNGPVDIGVTGRTIDLCVDAIGPYEKIKVATKWGNHHTTICTH